MRRTKTFSIARVDDSPAFIVRELAIPAPGPHQVQIRAQAIVVDGTTSGQRAPHPSPLRSAQGAGTVVEIGSAVRDLKIGDRTAWCDGSSNVSTYINRDLTYVAPVPRMVSMDVAAAFLRPALQAHYLTSMTYEVRADTRSLVRHSPQSATSRFLVQMINRVGSPMVCAVEGPREEIALSQTGAVQFVPDDEPAVESAVRAIGDGRGVDVVYDQGYPATLTSSLAALRPRGLLVLLERPDVPAQRMSIQHALAAKSLRVTMPSLRHHVERRGDFLKQTRTVYSMLLDGILSYEAPVCATVPELLERRGLRDFRPETPWLLLSE